MSVYKQIYSEQFLKEHNAMLDDMRAARLMPEMAAEKESELIAAARQYEASRNELEHLTGERDRIEEMIKRAIHQKEDATNTIIAILQGTPEVRKARY